MDPLRFDHLTRAFSEARGRRHSACGVLGWKYRPQAPTIRQFAVDFRREYDG